METIYYSYFNSRLLKKVFVASTGRGVCFVDFARTENPETMALTWRMYKKKGLKF